MRRLNRLLPWAAGLLLAACHAPQPTPPGDAPARAAATAPHAAQVPVPLPLPALVLQRVADGIYMHQGAHEEPDAHNHGAVANMGFVVGSRCVAVIDSGASLAAGEALRAALRRVTDKPVCWLVNTHMHPDHVLGNAAFEQSGEGGGAPAIVGHTRLAAALAARAGNYLSAMRRDLGQAAEGSRVLLPTVAVTDRMQIDLGGRLLTLTAWPTAHTDNDLSVWDERTRTLWTGDLLFVDRVPAVDGRLMGWIARTRAWQALAPRQVVPGHGDWHCDWQTALAAQLDYLQAVEAEVRAALRAGRSLSRMLEAEALDAQAAHPAWDGLRKRWALFDRYHRRNLTAAYAELEWE